MSMRLQNWHRSSSRRNVTTFTMSSLIALIVSSPFATRCPVTEPESAPAMISPRLSSLSSIARDPSALDRAGAADLILQQQHAREQRLGGPKKTRPREIDPHHAVPSVPPRQWAVGT